VSKREKYFTWAITVIAALAVVLFLALNTGVPFIQSRLPWASVLLGLAVLTYKLPFKIAITVGSLVCALWLGLYFLGTPAPTRADRSFVHYTLFLATTIMGLIVLRHPREKRQPT